MTPEGTSLISDRLIRAVRRRLSEGQRVRRTLPDWGRLAIDRPLPFLCVYRRPSRKDDRGTYSLVTSEASYLTCTANRRQQEGIGRLATTVVETLAGQLGGFLVLEIWAGDPPEVSSPVSVGSVSPSFRIFAPKGNGHAALTAVFEEALGRIRLDRRNATVSTTQGSRRWPRGLKPILSPEEADRMGCVLFGLEVSPLFRHPESGDPFPRVLNELRRNLSVALRQLFYEYSRSSTSSDPAHFHAMGRRAVVKAVWEVDQGLADASETYDFLLQLSPTNTEQAWNQFEQKNFQKPPVLRYRPLLVDPVVLKRQLFRVPVERIEDPSLAHIFRQKLYELDRQITMFQDRNTGDFLHESIQLYGGVDKGLHALAADILQRIPPRSRESASKGSVDAEAFAERAREEIEFLRAQRPDLSARVEIRPDVAGLMVSRGNLLVSSGSSIPGARVEALIQHEVGTHVLTYHNGRAQKLRILSTGLTGYDSLQEGLAVLAEYLVGGLSRPRLRLLAARVVAVQCLLDGASFIDTFRELRQNYGFANRTAFMVTVRTYRSGGLTKDAVYLQGLRQILAYIGGGGELDPLFVGKIAIEHIPMIRELTWRGVLVPPPLTPAYLTRPDTQQRINRLRKGVGVLDLIERSR